MINQHAKLYEERVHSPLRRFNDKTFTPTRYWHIKGNETTVDAGWGDTGGIANENSSIKYVMIENLPIGGIEPILPQLQSGDNGLDTTFEAEGVTMDGTIRPFENDFFMINYLKSPWLFRVTSVEYDNLGSDSIYKIQYVLEYINNERVEQLMRQTVGEYTFVIDNIGTDQQCIIEKSDMERINKVNSMYDVMMGTYKNLYYNERYNCFLGDFGNGRRIYDPLQSEFINRHRLFTQKNQIDGLVLTDQFKDPQRDLKYQKSIYRCIELRRMRYLNRFRYSVFDGYQNPQTAFAHWVDTSVVILDIPRLPDNINPVLDKGAYYILSDEFVDSVKMNMEMPSPQANLVRRYLRGEELTVSDISLSMYDDLLDAFDANLEMFFLTPVLMYIIRDVIKTRMAKERRTDTVEFL